MEVLRHLQESEERPRSRSVPLANLLLSETALGNAQTLTPAARTGAMRVQRLVASNVTGTAATVSVYADTLPQIVGLSVAANSAVDLTDLIGGLYANHVDLLAYAGTADAIVVSGYYEDMF